MKTARKLAHFEPLNEAEQKIWGEIDSGKPTTVGTGDLPSETAMDDTKVRGSFIRYLALGGCEACHVHETGLRILGANITGPLNLEGCTLPNDLGLVNCRFNETLVFRSAVIKNLFLSGSLLPLGLDADGLEAKGDVFLRGVEAHGAVRLLGAKLGGGLECDGAKFNAAKNKDGSPSGHAFCADGLEAKGAFFLCEGAEIAGPISLANASFAALSDELACWPQEKGSIFIDGFRYGAILGANAPVDAHTRLKWLDKVDHTNGFSPQPYEQLAKVLREMGHRTDARAVLIKKEELQRKVRREKLRKDMLVEDAAWFAIWDRVMKWTVRYGYRPFGALGWLAGIMVLGMLIFGNANKHSGFKPNDSRVWLSEEWGERTNAAPSQVSAFLDSDAGKSYPAFNPFIYSADVLLPIVDFDMQDVWIPDEDKAPWVRRYMWLHIALGWFFSLLAVAGFTGLIKPE